MGAFTKIFGGGNIYPVEPTYSELTYGANISLSWPVEQAAAGALVVTKIIDLNPTAGGLTVTLPDARQVSTGYTALFNNISGFLTSVLGNDGTTLITPPSGTVWELYLVDNSTAVGTWRVFQFGAGVSVANAAALAGAGLAAIGATLNEQMLIQPKNATPYNMVVGDLATVLQWTGGVGVFNLPLPATAGNAWFVVCKNQGSGNLTIDPAAGTIDGNANLTLGPGASAWLITDGNNFFSLLGGSIAGGSGFNLLQIDVSGTGNFVLSGAQLNQVGYRFVGVLTGNRVIVVPNSTQEYWVDNETTGAFTLSVATAGQASPPTVPQANRYILYCDGTSVINALTNSVVFPIVIGQGGTGATTAAGALANLGGTIVGTGVFTAANTGAALTALGGTTVGQAVFTAANATAGQAALGATATGEALFTAASAAAARTTLGVTATGADNTYAFRANNLSDLANAATARGNLGLGSLATLNTAAAANVSGGVLRQGTLGSGVVTVQSGGVASGGSDGDIFLIY